MMFTLTKSFRFEAAHHLPNHDGKCRRKHGHSWTGSVVVDGDTLFTDGPKAGMLIDYYDLSVAVNPIVEEYLDHHDLNQTLDLKNPTSELIAKWLFDKLKPRLPMLVAVIINETCTSACEYRPSKWD